MGRYDVLEEVEKFNPYHGVGGRFASADVATSMTWRPGRGAMYENAIAREKERSASAGATVASKPNTSTQKDHPEGEYEGPDRIAKDLGVSDEEATTMHRAIRSYSGSAYGDIRHFQTQGPPPDMKEAADAIESFIEKSPKWDGGTVYRGMRVDHATAWKIVSNAMAGKTISMLGSSSWSSDDSVAEGFAETYNSKKYTGIIFRSSGKQNGTSIKHLSNMSYENEVLMSNSARWKPTNVIDGWDGIYIIDCEPIN